MKFYFGLNDGPKKKKRGYRAFAYFPYGVDEINGITYKTYDECLNYCLRNYKYEEIGIDYCEDRAGCISVLERIKTPTQQLWEEEDDYE